MVSLESEDTAVLAGHEIGLAARFSRFLVLRLNL